MFSQSFSETTEPTYHHGQLQHLQLHAPQHRSVRSVRHGGHVLRSQRRQPGDAPLQGGAELQTQAVKAQFQPELGIWLMVKHREHGESGEIERNCENMRSIICTVYSVWMQFAFSMVLADGNSPHYIMYNCNSW